MPTPLIETPTIPGKVVLVTGKKRDGKSWFVYHQIFLPFKGPAIYIDPKAADNYIRGEKRRTVKQVQDHPANKIIFQIQPGASADQFDEQVHELIQYLINWKRGYPGVPLLVVLDEAYRYMLKSGMDDGPDALVQTCSALDINTVIINPDYSTVPRQLYLQADYCVFFTAHPVIEMYLEDRLTMNLPKQVWQHVARNQTTDQSKKGYAMMIDWSNTVWLLYPDGHWDSIQGGTDDEETGEDDDSGNPDAEGGKGAITPGSDGAAIPEKPLPAEPGGRPGGVKDG